jgi:hypothetical protein
MDRVEEIEAAIGGLTQEEYRRIVQWFRVRERWDDQLDSGSSTGKLDFVFNETESESGHAMRCNVVHEDGGI